MKKYFKKTVMAFLFIVSVTIAQDVITDSAMVASAHPLASMAGQEILEQGGNAVDAAVATAFALGVVEPNASGLGGGGFMVIKMAGMKEGVTIDYRETAPQKATETLYYDNEKDFSQLTHHGVYSIGIPGVVAGLSLALEKYGTMSLKEVLQPAIRYAKEGFEVSEKFSGMILYAYDLISTNESTSNIYLNDGLPPEAGMIIKNTDLAKTFEHLIAKGANDFYSGELAQKIAGEIKDQHGIITLQDLKNYQSKIKNPIKGSYRGYQILSSAPPTGGGTHLVELLNILEGYNLKKMKHNSAEYIHLLAEAMKICFADKSNNMADPGFYNVPVEKLTDKNYAKDRRKYIKPKEASFEYISSDMLSRESGSTTHLSVIDLEDNMVALTQSINYWFGSGITVKETGILLNNHLHDFDGKKDRPNSIEPLKRPVSSIAPTLVLKDGKPFLTLGTPGGSRIIGALAQIIINIIDFDMSMDEAIEAPRVHSWNNKLHIEGRIKEVVVQELEKKGHKIEMHKDFDNYFGGAQGILVDQKTGDLIGGADSRRDGVASGY